MSLTSTTTEFKVLNRTQSASKALQLFDMDEIESYSNDRVGAGYRYTNNTVGYIGDEKFDITCKDFNNMGNIGLNTSKMSADKVVSYGPDLRIMVVTSVDAGNGVVRTYEDPIDVQLYIRHPKTDYIQSEHVREAIGRAVSLLIPEDNSNKRISALMKGDSLINAD